MGDRVSGWELIVLLTLGTAVLAPFSCWRIPEAQRQPLRVWVQGKPEHVGLIRRAVKIYQNQHSELLVKLEEFPAGQVFMQKLLPAMQAGAAADVIHLHWSTISEVAHKQALVPLDELVARDRYDLDDFFSGSTNAYTIEGRLYAIPVMGSTMLLFYNKDLFDEAGVAYPSDDWTWSDFLSAAKRLTKIESGRFVQVGAHPYDPASWIWSGGGAYGTDDLKTLYFTDPRTIEALQFYIDLRNKHRVTPTKMDLHWIDETRVNVFESGRLAMEVAGPWKLPTYTPIKKFQWDVALFPKGPAGRQTRYAGMGFGIWSGSDRKEEAWELVKYMCGKVAGRVMAEGLSDLPARRSVAYSEAFLFREYAWDMEAFLRAMEPQYATIRIFPKSVLWSWVKRQFDDHLERAAVEGTDLLQMMQFVENMTRQEMEKRGALHTVKNPT